ncbi:gamma-mobile-trio recombinase GmtY [Caballeronia sp. DA-9]|uniref:gamma-mobile-trio recombinase GmtY n=1 Tax=Caballeronia sp. DA-9 TaxID=3436237 RepID=UPI003F67EB46
MHSLHGHHHVWVLVEDRDRIGRLEYLLIAKGDFVWPVWRFFKTHLLELASERTYAQALGMLVDFIGARGDEFQSIESRTGFFQSFAGAVLFGTVRDGNDPTNLWWYPRSIRRARKLLRCVCTVSDWLSDRYQTTAINPFTRQATLSEQIAFWRRWNNKTASQLLSHLTGREPARVSSSRARQDSLPRREPRTLETQPSFPDHRMRDLLLDGFALSSDDITRPLWKRWNVRDIMVTLLLHYGGLRVSEPFHLWVDDVFVTQDKPDFPVVLVHHPSDGLVQLPGTPFVASNVTRAAYLRAHYNMTPLTLLSGKRHVGWKESLLTRPAYKAFEVIWSSLKAASFFLYLYRLYITHVRPTFLNHPFLFFNQYGEPMAPAAFRKSHGRAVERIGLSPSRPDGTTSHGHRHAYGRLLKRLGLSEKEIMVCMHHSVPQSQHVYTTPTVPEVHQAMHTLVEPTSTFDLHAEFSRI